MDLEKTLDAAFRLTLSQKMALDRIGLKTVKDLLYHFPSRYIEPGHTKKISDLRKGDEAVLHGIIDDLKTAKAYRKNIPLAQGNFRDDTGKLKVVWFNQPFIAKTFTNGSRVKISGKIQERKGGLYISNPEIEYSDNGDTSSTNSLFGKSDKGDYLFLPVYPESRGVTSRWFFHAIQKLLLSNEVAKVTDIIPDNILRKYNLPKLQTALIWIHSPKNLKNAEAARKRFAFEEIFLIQIRRLLSKKDYSNNKSFPVKISGKQLNEFISKFPFEFTKSQTRSLDQVLIDLSEDTPMSRLLEGDVGSGKTAVASAAIYATINTHPPGQDFGRLEAAIMVPTEVLARQHFESFIEYFRGSGINIGLITGSECRKFPSKIDPTGHTHISRAQLLKWVANGEIPVLVGTHSLIQKSVEFKNLSLVIIDEQHRFGVKQRAQLANKKRSRVPHLLTMTATPIPRTLALTLYGDLDLSVIDEMPIGRKPIITEIVDPNKRQLAYKKMREELSRGRQAYVICPRIEEPDPSKELAVNAKSAKKERDRLKREIFPEYEVGLIHSKMKPKDKAHVMSDFESGKINILTSTSVIEVGVNIPNATVILIEGAERFGLAQLHQLRGRVLRSNDQAYCFLFSDSKSQKTKYRLSAIKNAKSGFQLAEMDLEMRGEGTLAGIKQWGISDVGMEAIKNLKMVEAAREEAKNIVDKDKLTDFPKLAEKIEENNSIFHFE